jgi:hypothetical protein
MWQEMILAILRYYQGTYLNGLWKIPPKPEHLVYMKKCGRRILDSFKFLALLVQSCKTPAVASCLNDNNIKKT